MTGLETVQDRPEVKQYLGSTQQVLGHLMPGWGSWERPHIIKRNGGILPIWEGRLLYKSERFCRLMRWIDSLPRKKPSEKRLRALRRRGERFYKNR